MGIATGLSSLGTVGLSTAVLPRYKAKETEILSGLIKAAEIPDLSQ